MQECYGLHPPLSPRQGSQDPKALIRDITTFVKIQTDTTILAYPLELLDRKVLRIFFEGRRRNSVHIRVDPCHRSNVVLFQLRDAQQVADYRSKIAVGTRQHQVLG